jgi:hypothetical protein
MARISRKEAISILPDKVKSIHSIPQMRLNPVKRLGSLNICPYEMLIL